jgi:DnaK suppressor protein
MNQTFRLMCLYARANPPPQSRYHIPNCESTGLAESTLSHFSVMAAKKTTSTSTPETPAEKPTVKATKSAKVVPTAEKTPKPKPAKKVAVADKPEKKAPKPAATKEVKIVAEAPPTIPKPTPAPKKVAQVKPRSSVVDYPAPPAPIKPPFVPPKAVIAPADGPVPAGSNGTHSPAFIQRQRQRLLDLRDDLVDAVSGMARDTIRNGPEGSEASGSGQHQGDAGSDAYDRDFALSVLAKEQDALYEIEQALRRIQAGSYGICEISNRKIPQTRLEVIPFARLTVECQAQWEKEYGNRRFRPSNEVGFSGGKYVDDDESETVSLDEDDD